MDTNQPTPTTEYTRDVTGRYVCNTFGEALRSTDRSTHPAARPFDFIIVGGGSFGSVLASHLFSLDKTRAHRILVLEAGPLVFTEHIQNQPLLNTDEVWGVPWNSDSPQTWNQQFPGLAYCVGGRSLFWGGWSPYLIESELPSPPWPANVKNDLTEPVREVGDERMSYLDEAARQLGADESNDFANGALHFALRDTLFEHLRNRSGHADPVLTGHRGTPMNSRKSPEELENELEAPLAIQSTIPRAGFFPFNKFSAIQLLVRAARMAQIEAEQSAGGGFERQNAHKRLMVVDNTHVIRLERAGRRITRIVTNKGTIDVPEHGMVWLAQGTIENTRMALNTLPNRYGLIGRNLMAHLRSNMTIRVKRSSFGEELDPQKNPELQSSALFVKGIHKFADGSPGHFQVQVTAAGVGAVGMDPEADLYQKLPDLDLLDNFKNLTDEWIVINFRSLGEMFGDKTSPDPRNRITLGGVQSDLDYGVPRALVRLDAGPEKSKELELWNVMDQVTDELARALAKGGPIQYLSSQVNGVWQDNPPAPDARRDPLSATHLEAGTLWMGDGPETSVTDEWGRFHEADNLYAIGPALLPTVGSANPMLSGIALLRRTADRLVPRMHPRLQEQGFETLFDGTEMTFNSWKAVGQGAFALMDGMIVTQPDGDLGLLYYAPRTFDDFTLRLQFKMDRVEDDSGILVRMREPRRPVPDRRDPNVSHPYKNPAYVGADTGFEIQIDEVARGAPPSGTPEDRDEHRTGAIYGISIGRGTGQQIYHRGPILVPGRWYDCDIEVKGDTYKVRLNGEETAVFTNADAHRGRSPEQDRYSGYIGLQSHVGHASFRDIRIQVREPVELPALALETGAIEATAVVWRENESTHAPTETTIKPNVTSPRKRSTNKA